MSLPPSAGEPSPTESSDPASTSTHASRRRHLRLWLRLRRFWRARTAPQKLLLGFLSYVLLGWIALQLPFAQSVDVNALDNLFGVVSAMSTTGLVTVATGDSYTFFGELVHLILMQLGGIGYMTLSSFIVLATGRKLTVSRSGVHKVGFALPHYFRIDRFVLHVIIFTLVIESVGAAILYVEFRQAGQDDASWSAIFHSVSAFATAGFGLYSNSLEDFKYNAAVNITITVLCYAGAIGFIVAQDVWYSVRYRERMLTFTSKVILTTTTAIFVFGTVAFYFIEPSIRQFGVGDRLVAAAFQVMTASSTAGFNTIPVGPLGMAALWVIVIAMLIGASPSGTGGGIKTTSVSALFAAVISGIRGRTTPSLLGNSIPPIRFNVAVGSAVLYLILIALGVFVLSLSERADFLKILFEVTSAIGTVGLSMGLTAELSTVGKWTIIALMFVGRVGVLTLGMALFASRTAAEPTGVDDLAT